MADDGGTSRRHYWWLAYEWGNLYPSCTECHDAQGAKFPTRDERVRVGTTEELNKREAPFLLDPTDDDPEKVLVYSDEGIVVSGDRRSLVTIETFELNRPRLVSERKEAIAAVKESLARSAAYLETDSRSFATQLAGLYSESAPFAAVRRQFANQWAQSKRRMVERALLFGTNEERDLDSLAKGLRRITTRIKEETLTFYERGHAGTDTAPPEGTEDGEARDRAFPSLDVRVIDTLEEEVPYLRAVEAHRLEIRNFRGIEHLDIDLSPGAPEGSWTMLLGENGVGKTSILQALALTLCDPETIDQLGLNPSRLLRQGSDQCTVRVQLPRGHRELRFGRGIETFEVTGSPIFGVLLAGYGPIRLLPDGPAGDPPPQKVANLFDPRAALVDPRKWLPSLGSEEFDTVARALRTVLELPEDEEITRRRGLEIVRGKTRYGLDQLSDGYRSMAIFALDLMQLLLPRWGTIAAAEGIVLIDEIGAHLHPRWQMRVTGLLRQTFPRMQFVATTHDPLCLRGLRDGEVVALRQRGRIVYALHDELPPVEGLAVDQLLTSEHFGLSSTLDSEIQGAFDRYYELIAKGRRSVPERDELSNLADRLDRLQLMGTTLRERLALEAVDEFLAEDGKVDNEEGYIDLKESTRQAALKIWEGT